MLIVGKPGITGTNITSIGLGTVSVGGGGGEVIKPVFWLRDDFLTDEPAPLASPRTAEPGPGTLNVTDTMSNAPIDDGLRLQGFVSTDDPSVVSAEPRLRQPGRAVLFYRYGSPGRLTLRASSDNKDVIGFGNAISLPVEGGNNIGFSMNVSRWYICVARSSGGFWILGDKLAFVASGVDAPIQPSINGNFQFGSEQRIGSMRGADLGGPWLDDYGIATDRIAGSVSAGATFGHEADCLVEWTQTTVPSSGYTDVWLRRIDADNGIVVSTASDGTVELYAVESGNWSQLGFTSAGTAANGHRFVVVCDGADIRVHSNDGVRMTNTSSVGQSATSGRLDTLGTGGAVSNVVSWPRVISGIAKQWLDAAIAD